MVFQMSGLLLLVLGKDIQVHQQECLHLGMFVGHVTALLDCWVTHGMSVCAQIAIYGYHFCKACCRAFSLLMRNILR